VKINEELNKEEDEYRKLFTQILDEYKKNKESKDAIQPEKNGKKQTK